MELITPHVGLLFWMLLIFTSVILILKKFAWKPILNALKERERSIENALQSAEKAKSEISKLNADNESLLAKSRQERELMMKEAQQLKDKILSDAREKAQEEGQKLIAIARESIENEKKSAIEEIKIQIASLSVLMAEKIIRQNLDKNQQEEYVKKLLQEVKQN